MEELTPEYIKTVPDRVICMSEEGWPKKSTCSDIVIGVEQVVITNDYVIRVGPRAVFGPTLQVLMHANAAGKRFN